MVVAAATFVVVPATSGCSFREYTPRPLDREGARVAQHGTGEDILLRPADDFVRSFVGGARRELHVEDRTGTPIVVDASGRVAGTLVQP